MLFIDSVFLSHGLFRNTKTEPKLNQPSECSNQSKDRKQNCKKVRATLGMADGSTRPEDMTDPAPPSLVHLRADVFGRGCPA